MNRYKRKRTPFVWEIITEQECIEAIKAMENGNSPGSDGIKALQNLLE